MSLPCRTVQRGAVLADNFFLVSSLLVRARRRDET